MCIHFSYPPAPTKTRWTCRLFSLPLSALTVLFVPREAHIEPCTTHITLQLGFWLGAAHGSMLLERHPRAVGEVRVPQPLPASALIAGSSCIPYHLTPYLVTLQGTVLFGSSNSVSFLWSFCPRTVLVSFFLFLLFQKYASIFLVCILNLSTPFNYLC